MAQNLPANAGNLSLIPGWERFPGEVATLSSILAWETPWTEELGGLQSMGSQKSRTQFSDSATTRDMYWLAIYH